MVFEELKKLSLNELISRLHSSITSFVKGVDELQDRNREMSLIDIMEIRDHVRKKIENGEEPVENERLLKLIGLFKENKNSVELFKVDAEEWIGLLEAIETHLEQKGGDLTPKEAVELAGMKKDIYTLRAALRKTE